MAQHAGGKSQDNGPIKPEVFLGRLPQGVTKEEIDELCSPYGATEVRLHANKGCAFARFESFEQAERAIESLNGAKISEGLGDGINAELADFKGAQKGVEKRPKVFIGGVSRECTEDAIRERCSQFGTVTYAKIFVKGGKSPPCAFCTFALFSEAEKCINTLNNAQDDLAEDGKMLNAQWADVQRAPDLMPPPMAGYGMGGYMPGYAAGPHSMPALTMGMQSMAMGRMQYGGVACGAPPHHQGYGFGRYPQRPPSGPAMADGPVSSRKVFVGGLHPDCSEDFICGMMAPFGEIVEAKVLRTAGRQPCGFIRFATDAQGADAVATLSARPESKFNVQWAEDKGTGGPKRGLDTPYAPQVGQTQKRAMR